MLEILTKILNDFANSDWNACKASMDENVVYEEPGTRVSVKGVDRCIDVLKAWKRAFPDAKATILSSLESGDRAVLEVEWRGTQSGPFESAFGTIEPTNKVGIVKAMIAATFKNGKLVEEHHYFDLLTILSQLGVTAGLPGAQAQKPAPEARPVH